MDEVASKEVAILQLGFDEKVKLACGASYIIILFEVIFLQP